MLIYKNDIIHFLSTCTWYKLWNACKVWLSFYLSKYLKRPIQWGLPFHITLEPTTQCNLRCPECPSGLRSFTRDTGRLGDEILEKLLNEQGKSLLYLYLYFQGEPYMHPKFLNMVSLASQRGIYTVTSTNGHYLTKNRAKQTVLSGLGRIIVSIDGIDQQTYASYRKGGSLNKVIEGIKHLVEAKRENHSTTPHIVLQFLVFRTNQHQIKSIKQLAKDLAVDELALKSAQIYDYKKGHKLIPTIDKYARYKQSKEWSWYIKNRLENHCWKLWHASVLTWDGWVVPCCFDKDAHHKMGNIAKISFTSIWRGKAYNAFRKRILKSRSSVDMCTNCTEGTKVWL